MSVLGLVALADNELGRGVEGITDSYGVPPKFHDRRTARKSPLRHRGTVTPSSRKRRVGARDASGLTR